MRVRVLVSFNGMRKGDTGGVHPDAQSLVKGYVGAGLMEVIDDGETEAGPRGPAQGDPGGEPERTGEDGPAGGEPGEDPVSG